MERHVVSFEPLGVDVEAPHDATIANAAQLAGIVLRTPCGGLGTCGRCTVGAVGRLSAVDADEEALLGAGRLAEGLRLACRARVEGDAVVTVEPGSEVAVVTDSDAAVFAVEAPALRGITGEGLLLGAAVDIGTTTLAVRLVDLEDGRPVASATALNPQTSFGDDVMSRIAAVAAEGSDALRTPLLVAIDRLLARALADAGAQRDALREVAACGNTTMVHTLLGIDTAPLGVAPYEPAFVASTTSPAAEIGLRSVALDTPVFILPGVSAFVGGDVVAGVLATGLDEGTRPAMLLDLGTNGEIVLRTPDGMVASSAAAGPALEGATISVGMLAQTGAVERVSLVNDELVLGVIGGVVPRGLCGSGLIDLVAVLLDAGVIDATGLLRPDAAHPLARSVGEDGGVRVFRVADGVMLTQHDVRKVQLAIAAVAAAIDLTLETAGVDAEAVEELTVAGGFGLHVDAGALVRLGAVPPQWADRIRFAGNTALAGATAALLDSAARRRVAVLAHHIDTVELATHPGFQARFIAGMTFPAA